MQIALVVAVKQSAGAYTARICKSRASSTQSAELAVQRAAEKYVAGTRLRVLSVNFDRGDNYRVVITDEQ